MSISSSFLATSGQNVFLHKKDKLRRPCSSSLLSSKAHPSKDVEIDVDLQCASPLPSFSVKSYCRGQNSLTPHRNALASSLSGDKRSMQMLITRRASFPEERASSCKVRDAITPVVPMGSFRSKSVSNLSDLMEAKLSKKSEVTRRLDHAVYREEGDCVMASGSFTPTSDRDYGVSSEAFETKIKLIYTSEKNPVIDQRMLWRKSLSGNDVSSARIGLLENYLNILVSQRTAFLKGADQSYSHAKFYQKAVSSQEYAMLWKILKSSGYSLSRLKTWLDTICENKPDFKQVKNQVLINLRSLQADIHGSIYFSICETYESIKGSDILKVFQDSYHFITEGADLSFVFDANYYKNFISEKLPVACLRSAWKSAEFPRYFISVLGVKLLLNQNISKGLLEDEQLKKALKDSILFFSLPQSEESQKIMDNIIESYKKLFNEIDCKSAGMKKGLNPTDFFDDDYQENLRLRSMRDLYIDKLEASEKVCIEFNESMKTLKQFLYERGLDTDAVLKDDFGAVPVNLKDRVELYLKKVIDLGIELMHREIDAGLCAFESYLLPWSFTIVVKFYQNVQKKSLDNHATVDIDEIFKELSDSFSSLKFSESFFLTAIENMVDLDVCTKVAKRDIKKFVKYFLRVSCSFHTGLLLKNQDESLGEYLAIIEVFQKLESYRQQCSLTEALFVQELSGYFKLEEGTASFDLCVIRCKACLADMYKRCLVFLGLENLINDLR